MKIYDPDIEKLIIGCALNSQDALSAICQSLEARDFQNPENRDIFNALYALYIKDISINPKAVHVETQAMGGNIDINNLLIYKMEHTGEEDLPYFINNLRQVTQNRHYYDALKIANERFDEAKSVEEEVEKLSALFTPHSSSSTSQTIEQLFSAGYKGTDLPIHEYITWKRDCLARGEEVLTGISTGFQKLDIATDGLQPSWFYVFGARPSEGKTQFLLNIIRNIIIQDIPCLFFSLELPGQDAVMELATIHGRVSHKNLNNGTFDPYDMDKFMTGCNVLKTKPLIVDDQPSLTTQQIKLRIKKAVASRGVRAVFIDYLQEVKPSGRFVNQQEAMQSVSRDIREMAKEFKIPIICAAQVNRESEKTEDTNPPLASQLRESGQIEQCAWFIGMLHRPDKNNPSNFPGALDLYIRKNRFGEKPKIRFSYQPDFPAYSYRIEET